MRNTVSILLAVLMMALVGCTDKTPAGNRLPDQSMENYSTSDEYRSYNSGGTDDLWGNSYEQMLENARVRDRDGILTDGENSVS